jgi:hypothetical protein
MTKLDDPGSGRGSGPARSGGPCVRPPDQPRRAFSLELHPVTHAVGISLLGCLMIATPLAPALAAQEPANLSGAYCPIPESGQAAECLDVARTNYGDFLSEVEGGAVPGETGTQLEADLLSSDHAYLALSSLAYGYYKLAQQAASAPEPSPTLIARLDHWNQLLLDLYEDSGDNPQLQRAVREAAADLEHRVSSIDRSGSSPCPGRTTSRGTTSNDECSSASLLVRGLKAADEEGDTHGIRGALARLLGRLRADSASIAR